MKTQTKTSYDPLLAKRVQHSHDLPTIAGFSGSSNISGIPIFNSTYGALIDSNFIFYSNNDEDSIFIVKPVDILNITSQNTIKSVIIGSQITVSVDDSSYNTSIGHSNVISGSSITICGNSNETHSNDTVIIGNSNYINGSASTNALLFGNSLSTINESSRSIVIGSNTAANGKESIVIGNGISQDLAPVDNCLTIGSSTSPINTVTFNNSGSVVTLSNPLSLLSTITSTVSSSVNPGFNADLLDGQHSSYYSPIRSALKYSSVSNRTSISGDFNKVIIFNGLTGSTINYLPSMTPVLSTLGVLSFKNMTAFSLILSSAVLIDDTNSVTLSAKSATDLITDGIQWYVI